MFCLKKARHLADFWDSESFRIQTKDRQNAVNPDDTADGCHHTITAGEVANGVPHAHNWFGWGFKSSTFLNRDSFQSMLDS